MNIIRLDSAWKKYTAVIISTAICAFLFSYSLPDEYGAEVKIVDEYKVTDLLIGLNPVNVLLRDLNPSHGNETTDDIEVYARFLKSEIFFDKVLKNEVSKYQQSYADYLKEHYRFPFWQTPFVNIFTTESSSICKDIIKNNIKYNLTPSSMTVDILVVDQDPVVASEILDYVLQLLQEEIRKHKTYRGQANKQNAYQEMEKTRRDYHEALQLYSCFVDSHGGKASADSVKANQIYLENDYKQKMLLYQKASERYTRASFLLEKDNEAFAVVKRYNISQKPIAPTHWAYLMVFGIIAGIACIWHYLYKKNKAKLHTSFTNWGDLFSPWNITISIWVLILGIYYLQSSLLYPITSQFYISFFIWIPIFLICSILTYNLMADEHPRQQSGIEFNKDLFTVFFAISLIITPLYVYKILQIVMMFSTEDMMNNIRTLAVYGDGQGFLNYSIVINQSLFLVALWAYPKIPLWQVVVIALACLMNAFAIMEKGSIFFVFICIAFVLFEKGIIKIRSIVIAGGLLVVFFYAFNLARAETGSDYQGQETLLDFFAMYALSPPVAFCQLLPDVIPQFGTNTFESIYLFLDRFGISDIVVKDKRQEFAWVPIPTNVYTIFQPFFIDFGYKGIAFFSCLYGVVAGCLYRLYMNRESIGTCLYTYIVYVLTLQFYQENIFLSMVYVLQLTFFVILFTQQKFRIALSLPRL